ncbi:unnamed protein product [Kuraishia capsulata CBS 1993]|uniref:Non-structural maintenance of chromosomes element 1 homolog n=1 Tax=Kuraishia capsulata CBS 1993 TaxID=1382522 RepID=W6MLA8_9ASCO|nr:uncharacterized protein KUCA_T00003257001 [Kuraishia capsulata CBS 1993]CDK27279.1 unnamed protein product [Kuraishia capsulata CBS 1993]
MSYSQVHSALLQVLMQAGSIPVETLGNLAVELMASGLPEDEQVSETPAMVLEQCVVAINMRLHYMDLSIRQKRDQLTGEKQLTLVNQTADESIKLATQFTPNEVKAINEIVDYIFDEGNSSEERYSITSSKAIALIRKNTTKSTDQADSFLKGLYYQGWLDHQKEYIPATRMLAELGPMLIQRFGVRSPENTEGLISTCAGCEEILTLGPKCFNNDCHVRFHPQCLKHFFAVRSDGKCPNRNCDEVWDVTPENLTHLATIGPPGIVIPWERVT